MGSGWSERKISKEGVSEGSRKGEREIKTHLSEFRNSHERHDRFEEPESGSLDGLKRILGSERGEVILERSGVRVDSEELMKQRNRERSQPRR